MLTAHAFAPEHLKRPIELGARAYLPKDKLSYVVPFLKDVMTHEYVFSWRKVMKHVAGLFSKSMGPYWKRPDEAFWKSFENKIEPKSEPIEKEQR